MLVQRDTTARSLAEVDAKSQYIKAHTAVDQVLGWTLDLYNVDIEEARQGVVKREADMIPATVGQRR